MARKDQRVRGPRTSGARRHSESFQSPEADAASPLTQIKKNSQWQTLLSKSEFIEKLAANSDDLSKKDIRAVLEGLAAIAYKELNKSGALLVPGLAKFVVAKKHSLDKRTVAAALRPALSLADIPSTPRPPRRLYLHRAKR